LTLLTSKQGATEDFLSQHTNRFITFNQKLNESFNSAGIKDLNSLFNSLNLIFGKIKSKELKFSEALQKEISLCVVLLEYGVKIFVKTIVKTTQKEAFIEQIEIETKRLLLVAEGKLEELSLLAIPNLDEKSKQTDARSAFLNLFQELNKELEKAEKILDTYLRTKGENKEELPDVFRPLGSARGIFAIVGKPLLSKMVVEISSTWKKIENEGFDSVDKEELNKSIALLSGISLFVSAAKDDNVIESEEIYNTLIEKFTNNNKKIEIREIEETKLIEPEKVVEVEMVTPVVEDAKIEIRLAEKVTEVSNKFKDLPNDADLAEVYVMEAEEVFESLVVSFKALNKNLANNAEIANIRRYYHTLKGSGRMVGLNYIGEAGWIIEQVLNKVISGEIVFDESLLKSLEKATKLFESWVIELKEKQEAIIDVVAIRDEFIKYSKDIIISIELSTQESAVVPVVQEVQEIKPIIAQLIEKVEIQVPTIEKETVNIDGKEISLILFNMFIEESNSHVKGMEEFVNNNDTNGYINNNFILHSHTLSSISKTINLNNFAKLVNKIEFISNLASEKRVKL
jgi:chemosensory pili system protein ChpA (sensor histidine kinase/response regulator)